MGILLGNPRETLGALPRNPRETMELSLGILGKLPLGTPRETGSPGNPRETLGSPLRNPRETMGILPGNPRETITRKSPWES